MAIAISPPITPRDRLFEVGRGSSKKSIGLDEKELKPSIENFAIRSIAGYTRRLSWGSTGSSTAGITASQPEVGRLS